MGANRQDVIRGTKRIVLKVGSAVLTREDADDIDEEVFSNLAHDITEIKRAGKEIVLVTSGAIAIGMKKMGLKKRPRSIPDKQAVAAVGQSSLMARYKWAFKHHDVGVAQVLLTLDDIADRKRFLNARNTLLTLFGYGVIPIINENDTVAVDEIKFGDNDNLAASVTNLIGADLLIMLTDMDGLFDQDPRLSDRARLIPVVKDIDRIVLDWSGERETVFGTGGMFSKLQAAMKAAHFGVPTIIANGKKTAMVRMIMNAVEVGTICLPEEDKLSSRKHWIAFSARPGGRVFVDDGAVAAILEKGKSLLPSGIIKVMGVFDTGEVIHCMDKNGMEFARGISNYSSDEIEKIKGVKSNAIEKILGYRYYDEVIHRDNLVVL